MKTTKDIDNNVFIENKSKNTKIINISNKNKRWVLISGASTGIGRSIAEELANKGYYVIAGARKDEDIENLSSISNVFGIKLDVTKTEDLEKAVEKVKSLMKETKADITGKIYAIIANAGIAIAGALVEVKPEDFQRQFDVNVFGVHRLIYYFYPLFEDNYTRIILMSSDSGFFATPFFGPYCSSKFALEGYGDSLRRELALFGIKVIIIEPGRISTPIWNKGRNILEDLKISDSRFREIGLKIGEYAISKGNNEGLPPKAVAELVLKVLSVDKPKNRYLIAPNTRKYRLIKILPSKIIDRMLLKELKD